MRTRRLRTETLRTKRAQNEEGTTHVGRGQQGCRRSLVDLPHGGLPTADTGKTMRFTGTTILKVENGLITEEIGLDDGVSVLSQLGLITEGR